MNRIPKVSVSLVVIVCALLPTSAQAAVLITEIMYDVEGSDSGREWVEITNQGAASVDLSSYKLSENNTNHALSLIQGTGVLLPGASAIIADDASKFKIDWPSYSGALFDSSFSLSNTGESLAVKNGTLELEDSVSYDSTLGAQGDGKSLTRSGASFAPVAPTPGSATETSTPPNVDQTPTTETVVSATAEVLSDSQEPSRITLRVVAEDRVMVGGGSFFEAKVYGSKGIPLPGRIMWNFGDGSTAEGTRVFHAYSYPGTYAVTVSGSYEYSFAMQKVKVEAVAAEVALRAEGDGSLTVINRSNSDLDVGLWSLYQNGFFFVIPEDTVVFAGEGVRFAPGILGFFADQQATLRYPNESVAATARAGVGAPARGTRVPAAELQPVYNAPLIVPREPEETSEVDINAPALPAEEASSQGAAAAQSGSPIAFWQSLLGLGVVLGLGIAGAHYARVRPAEREEIETYIPPEEFEIE